MWSSAGHTQQTANKERDRSIKAVYICIYIYIYVYISSQRARLSIKLQTEGGKRFKPSSCSARRRDTIVSVIVSLQDQNKEKSLLTNKLLMLCCESEDGSCWEENLIRMQLLSSFRLLRWCLIFFFCFFNRRCIRPPTLELHKSAACLWVMWGLLFGWFACVNRNMHP